jgi:hypothetical protein
MYGQLVDAILCGCKGSGGHSDHGNANQIAPAMMGTVETQCKVVQEASELTALK